MMQRSGLMRGALGQITTGRLQICTVRTAGLRCIHSTANVFARPAKSPAAKDKATRQPKKMSKRQVEHAIYLDSIDDMLDSVESSTNWQTIELARPPKLPRNAGQVRELHAALTKAFTRPKLVEYLKVHNLPTTGLKSELVDRVIYGAWGISNYEKMAKSDKIARDGMKSSEYESFARITPSRLRRLVESFGEDTGSSTRIKLSTELCEALKMEAQGDKSWADSLIQRGVDVDVDTDVDVDMDIVAEDNFDHGIEPHNRHSRSDNDGYKTYEKTEPTILVKLVGFQSDVNTVCNSIEQDRTIHWNLDVTDLAKSDEHGRFDEKLTSLSKLVNAAFDSHLTLHSGGKAQKTIVRIGGTSELDLETPARMIVEGLVSDSVKNDLVLVSSNGSANPSYSLMPAIADPSHALSDLNKHSQLLRLTCNDAAANSEQNQFHFNVTDFTARLLDTNAVSKNGNQSLRELHQNTIASMEEKMAAIPSDGDESLNVHSSLITGRTYLRPRNFVFDEHVKLASFLSTIDDQTSTSKVCERLDAMNLVPLLSPALPKWLDPSRLQLDVNSVRFLVKYRVNVAGNKTFIANVGYRRNKSELSKPECSTEFIYSEQNTIVSSSDGNGDYALQYSLRSSPAISTEFYDSMSNLSQFIVNSRGMKHLNSAGIPRLPSQQQKLVNIEYECRMPLADSPDIEFVQMSRPMDRIPTTTMFLEFKKF
ncbi:hypothetical protein GQ42DRAFT_57635 [Ramicandelaber brevisporus]|nr:hypothetical protein GQ42DRAFT_57635 [Ramicandelaber brevisporus]